MVDVVKETYGDELQMFVTDVFEFCESLLGGKYTSLLLEVFNVPYERSEEWTCAFKNYIITNWT